MYHLKVRAASGCGDVADKYKNVWNALKQTFMKYTINVVAPLCVMFTIPLTNKQCWLSRSEQFHYIYIYICTDCNIFTEPTQSGFHITSLHSHRQRTENQGEILWTVTGWRPYCDRRGLERVSGAGRCHSRCPETYVWACLDLCSQSLSAPLQRSRNIWWSRAMSRGPVGRRIWRPGPARSNTNHLE